MIKVKLATDIAERCGALAGAMQAHVDGGLQLLLSSTWQVWRTFVIFADGAAYSRRSAQCNCLDFTLHRMCSHGFAVQILTLDIQRPG